MNLSRLSFYSRHRDLLIIAVLSACIELAWFSIQNIGYLCDSPSYMQYAWRLFREPAPTVVTWTRTPGYPLLIALTGTVGPGGYFYTFKRLLGAQALMAIAMPVLVYKTLQFYNTKVAFYGALFFIASFAPFIMSK